MARVLRMSIVASCLLPPRQPRRSSGIDSAARLRLQSRAAALPNGDSFDGGFSFCRLMYTSDRREAERLRLEHRLPDADVNFSISPRRADQDAISRQPTGDPNHLVVRSPIRLLFQCPYPAARGRRHAASSPTTKCGDAARLSAEGRLPLGRRLLGPVRVGQLGEQDQQGAAARRIPDSRHRRSIIRSSA